MSAPTLAPLAEPPADRVLPGPTDPAWLDPATVYALAGIDPFDAERIERGAETTWMENERRPVDWGWAA